MNDSIYCRPHARDRFYFYRMFLHPTEDCKQKLRSDINKLSHIFKIVNDEYCHTDRVTILTKVKKTKLLDIIYLDAFITDKSRIENVYRTSIRGWISAIEENDQGLEYYSQDISNELFKIIKLMESQIQICSKKYILIPRVFKKEDNSCNDYYKLFR